MDPTATVRDMVFSFWGVIKNIVHISFSNKLKPLYKLKEGESDQSDFAAAVSVTGNHSILRTISS